MKRYHRSHIRTVIALTLLILIASSAFLFLHMPHKPAHALSVMGPASQIWYFAEGRVGGGFESFFTVGNPNATDCTVNIQYDFTVDGSGINSTKTVTFAVPHASRHTQTVNADLGISPGNRTGATLSAVVSTPDCVGIVAERVMYFHGFHGVSSGTDVFGAASAQKQWYFAEVPRGSAGESFLSVLNPNSVDATVQVSYFVGSATPVQVTQTVHANSRGTFDPNNTAELLSAQHLAVQVQSDQPIVVERPSYFVGVHGVSGSADVMAVPAPQTKWIMAAGSTTPGSQTNLIISNVSASPVTINTVELLALGGATLHTGPFTIQPFSQMTYDVNANNTFVGATTDVSAIVDASPATVAVQREIFSQYAANNATWTAQGVSDDSGVPEAFNAFSFAEGFTSSGFNEWVNLTNPTNAPESATITMVNMLGESDAQTVPMPAHSRSSFDVTHAVANSSVFSLNNVQAYAVSMVVSCSDLCAAERVMQWNALNTQGTSALVGFTGPMGVS